MATTNNNVELLSTAQILGREVAVYGTFENPLFLAKDVAEWIDYTKNSKGSYDVSNMLKSLEDDEKMIRTIFVSSKNRDVWMLTENGIHTVLMQNYSPEIKKFRIAVKTVINEHRRQIDFDVATLTQKKLLSLEEWRDIPGFEGYYQASNIGRIKNLKRSYVSRDGIKSSCPSKILKGRKGKTSPYLSVQLSVNGVAKNYMIHRLVAMSYLQNWNSSMEVNHIDGNVFNNIANNLELCTRKENYSHSIAKNLKCDYGQLSSNAKLLDVDVKRIRKLYRVGVKQNDLASIYGVCKQTICSIVNYKTYTKCV